MRLRLERIPEKDHEIDSALDDRRPDLLVAAQRTAEEPGNRKPDLARQERAGGAGRIQLVSAERATVVARPLHEIGLAVIVRDEGDTLPRRHRNGGGHSGYLSKGFGLWVVRVFESKSSAILISPKRRRFLTAREQGPTFRHICPT